MNFATQTTLEERVRTDPVAALRGVSRRYGDVLALDDVDLEIRPGQMVGMLGPNGAGKSTAISLLLGLRRPDSGTVTLFGGSAQDPACRRWLGSAPQETSLPETLRVGEVLSFVAGHYPDPVPSAELLQRFGMADLARRQTGGLSGGQRRKVNVALALIGRPRLVVLDEPTTGLDVGARHELWDTLRQIHAEGTTVLLTSHYLEEIEALAQRVVVLDRGRVLIDDSLERVLGKVGLSVVSLQTAAPDRVRGLAGVRSVTPDGASGDRHQVSVTDPDAFVRELVTTGPPFSGLTIRNASLEEAFAAITTAAPTNTPTNTSATTPLTATNRAHR